jgi:hypothetical protein
MKERQRGQPWTKSESDEALRLADAGSSNDEIASLLERTPRAVAHHVCLRRLGPARKAEYNRKRNEQRQKDREAWATTRLEITHEASIIYRPTPEMLADRDRRMAMPHRDLTAVLCGDPKIGQSALEGRR